MLVEFLLDGNCSCAQDWTRHFFCQLLSFLDLCPMTRRAYDEAAAAREYASQEQAVERYFMLLANTSLNTYWICHDLSFQLSPSATDFCSQQDCRSDLIFRKRVQLDRIDQRLNGSQRSLWKKLERCYLA